MILTSSCTCIRSFQHGNAFSKSFLCGLGLRSLLGDADDGSASQLDQSGLESRSTDEGATGNDLEDRAYNAFSQECLESS
ncbi:hypothetical protein DAPPUDRAFT_325770 [Daphnia pulex]|uniref:Uncharacterized protein n=1 Tax=Daphnia pulex TaxID=6669 RepID=E9H5I3_DAPPU|nr:hypothetical protein DAPPUDRAFT_325770 [Daphnia pulex]|eukprot:EFX72962.1 hypothetical protein DAPPUDRAFT_325770 [Daphnia pulex]